MTGDLDDNPTQHLKCDIELELSDPNETSLDKRVASALRDLADRLERQEFEDGFTDVKDGAGAKIGTIYVDYSEGFGLDADRT